MQKLNRPKISKLLFAITDLQKSQCYNMFHEDVFQRQYLFLALKLSSFAIAYLENKRFIPLAAFLSCKRDRIVLLI